MLKTFLQENQIIIPSYQSYGGLSGYQDYGILGFQIKSKLLRVWRELFIQDEVHEVELPSIMPYEILKSSGHVERFTDYVVYDNIGHCHRADHLVKDWFLKNKMESLSEKVDSMSREELEECINKYRMIPVDSCKVLTKNLMIEVSEYPKDSKPSASSDSGTNKQDFLRPELAQGIFVNFDAYLSFTQNTESFQPFGIAQVGRSYRKEISPQPYTRMREFTQAEIEYFVHPNDCTHGKFSLYKDMVVPLLSGQDQLDNKGLRKITIGEALSSNIISHELMAYFLGKIYTFAQRIGLKEDKIRFRQHLPNEMAHYANQCWDLECLVGGSWLECIGCADRGCYDLTAHGAKIEPHPVKVAKITRKLSEPRVISTITMKPNPKEWKDRTLINRAKDYLSSLSQAELLEIQHKTESFQIELPSTGYKSPEILECTPNMFLVEEKKTNVTQEVELFIPKVIEPSFGIDRLIYAVLEQNIWSRDSDEKRMVLSLKDELTVYNVAVFPLHRKDNMIKLSETIRKNLMENKFRVYMDNSNTTIGKRYSRADEIGVKYSITVDPGSIETGNVTVRNRDTMEQIVVHYENVMGCLV